ncbi:hypothetical protein LRD69_30550 [Streptomyces sp. JH14]|uniref:hypothetical protein n=1 Tax=Streptomyces sp. JH14 TaxID=2793630 RepID=UPI0023F67F51|nr:hypothetical protein [Streptomyces sp. JH14]MDF6046388.1 hypothetical protein [Streptomyces sp. JH14]
MITRNTTGSPVADLRDGPYAMYGTAGSVTSPPYGKGSLGIAVGSSAEKVDFGNEVDFYRDPVLGLTKVGFHVFQTGENASTPGTSLNMPSIRFEIAPNLNPATSPSEYSTLVWVPDAAPVKNRWSGYLDATKSGHWFLTGAMPWCNQTHMCKFTDLRDFLDDGGTAPIINSVAVGKGRDSLWVGAVDGLRINNYVYDFEADGVKARRVF